MEAYRYRIGSYTKFIGRPPVFVNSLDLIPGGYQFASVYAVTEETARAIVEAGTAEGFKGVVWSQRLWLDFDSYEAGFRAESKLKEMGYDFVVYDTGGRGVHIGVARDAKPSHLLPQQDKKWALATFPDVDRSLYWHLHMFRLPGAVHERTGNRKKLLRQYSGTTLVLPAWEGTELSHETRPLTTISRESIFNVWSVVSKLTAEPNEGDRHRHLVQLAKALQADVGVTEKEALWVLQEVNRGFAEPKPDDEVVRIVNWAFGLEG